MKRRVRLTTLLIVLFGTVFLVSLAAVSSILIKSQQEERAFEHLAGTVAQETMPPAESTPVQSTPAQLPPAETEAPSPYVALKEQNPDFFGWLSIEGTKLDYPVMYTPEDPEHYLRRDFEGGYSLSGVPFLDADCYDGGGNYLIYGHNMKNGSMFSSLLSYADSAYWDAHKTIRFDTMEEAGEYEVVAAFYSQAYLQDAVDVFRYYRYTDVSNPELFEEYMEQVQAAAVYDTGVTAEYGDQLLTLSTCSYHTKNGRFVVVARRAE